MSNQIRVSAIPNGLMISNCARLPGSFSSSSTHTLGLQHAAVGQVRRRLIESPQDVHIDETTPATECSTRTTSASDTGWAKLRRSNENALTSAGARSADSTRLPLVAGIDGDLRLTSK